MYVQAVADCCSGARANVTDDVLMLLVRHCQFRVEIFLFRSHALVYVILICCCTVRSLGLSWVRS